MLNRMSLRHIIDSPLPWTVGGFVIGLALGVTAVSASLLAVGFGAFLLYLRLHGPVEEATEGRLFASGPALMMSWVVGFIVRGLAF